ncbi:hypothetical protein POSPLADRAFT_1135977 [Postia placenta MAD-698-R-SB12]|uniref:Calcineurin-like phosphoesterase domain-containing protein n=1 Tax=Postia placenta MAD-698-R-SB12 TaxID=670580 RepID=A0A1X6N9Q1_9APHY|nr:hypothetical protein POSPLADRAFT_1135977 [Postia placenta MAD-698-R-SB12]OSX65378.1 hypothetical protein POSPLADRAFT_1135977 [Postia placenta MAD-698-R-SB12]
MKSKRANKIVAGTGNLVDPVLRSPTATVHLTYDPNSPPPHPGPTHTRFVCISDTHSHVYPVPHGDVLLHSGDLCMRGQLKHLQTTVDWLKGLPHPAKILIAGNHDLCLDNDWREGGTLARVLGNGIRAQDVDAAQTLMRSEELRETGIRYLEYEPIQITTASGRTWNIYGSPATPRYSIGSFQYEYGQGAEVCSRIPPETEVLLTHTPPHGTLNATRRGKAAGCKELTARLESRELGRCRLHVFGHIHESHGAVIRRGNGDGTVDRVSVNAALAYGGQAVIVDLEN